MAQALEPLYTEGEPITPYSWAGAHKADYDAEAQNAWGDLAMEVSVVQHHALTVIPALHIFFHAKVPGFLVRAAAP
jgi:hypothetical protein